MSEIIEQPLEDFVEEEINKIKEVDIVVGIPSYNNAYTIAKVIESFGEGLEKYYPGFRCLIVNSDGNSKDGTAEIVRKIKVPKGIKKIVTCYRGPSGKGSSFRTIFEIARRLDTKVCVVSDADTRSINPHWCYALVNPVLCLGYGYVTPYYTRDKHDATITNALVYPTTRALYGLRVRQPIGGDFSFSNGVLQILTRKKYWERYSYLSKFGIDIWMTTTAMNEGFRICQTALGTKVHDVKDPGKDLSSMFIQVVGTMFDLIGCYEYRWKNVIGSNQGYIFGEFKFVEVEKIKVNFKKLLKKFYLGLGRYSRVWECILDRDTLIEFKSRLGSSRSKKIIIPIGLWAKIVYDYACAYNFVKDGEKELVLESMLPLYFLRTASFIREAALFDDEIADAVVEGNAGVFERMKEYLISRWDYYRESGKAISIKNKIL